MLHIFIGYDAREDIAYRVAAHSIKRHCGVPCVITPLRLRDLRGAGIYWRNFRKEGNQMIDSVDGKPFSTEFSFSRFLVPLISRSCGVSGPVVFVDCDFLFYDDIHKMVQLADPSKAVSVVKHNFTPTNTFKMDGVLQSQYNRKLWSSLMVFDPQHPDCCKLDAETVNTQGGAYLHGFGWTESIGEIDEVWNWLPYHSPTTRFAHDIPKAVHFTDGGPWFPNYKDIPYGKSWEAEKALVLHDANHWNNVLDFSKCGS